MSTALLDAVVKKNRVRLIPLMLALYVLAFLDRSNIGFAKQTYQIDTGLSNEAYALGAGIFFCGICVSGCSGESLMRKPGGQNLGLVRQHCCGDFFRQPWHGPILKRNF